MDTHASLPIFDDSRPIGNFEPFEDCTGFCVGEGDETASMGAWGIGIAVPRHLPQQLHKAILAHPRRNGKSPQCHPKLALVSCMTSVSIYVP